MQYQSKYDENLELIKLEVATFSEGEIAQVWTDFPEAEYLARVAKDVAAASRKILISGAFGSDSLSAAELENDLMICDRLEVEADNYLHGKHDLADALALVRCTAEGARPLAELGLVSL